MFDSFNSKSFILKLLTVASVALTLLRRCCGQNTVAVPTGIPESWFAQSRWLSSCLLMCRIVGCIFRRLQRRTEVYMTNHPDRRGARTICTRHWQAESVSKTRQCACPSRELRRRTVHASTPRERSAAKRREWQSTLKTVFKSQRVRSHSS